MCMYPHTKHLIFKQLKKEHVFVSFTDRVFFYLEGCPALVCLS